MTKKLLLSLLCLSLFLHGCSRKKSKVDDSLLIWHWMTDRHEVFLELAEQYFEEKGVKVIFELNAPSDLYTTKVRAAAQTSTLPDIFGVLGGIQDLANFVQSNLIYEVTPYLNENDQAWKNTFFSKSLGMTSFVEENQWGIKPGHYGIPIDVSNIQMIYNEDIFKEAGISKVPETWGEFIEAGKKVVSNTDKHFFVAGFGETWIINSIVRNFAYNIMGEDKLNSTIKGDYSYDSKEWVDVFSKFEEMNSNNLFSKSIVTMINKSAERIFAVGKAAITINGSWCVNVFKGMNSKLNYRAMFFPRCSNQFPVVIHGGAGSSFVISENSMKKEKAIHFLKWLTNQKNQVYLASKTNNLPSNKNSIGNMEEILNQFADDMDNTIHPALLPYVEDPSVEEVIARGIQSIITKEMTAVELVKEVAQFKNKVIEENAENQK